MNDARQIYNLIATPRIPSLSLSLSPPPRSLTRAHHRSRYHCFNKLLPGSHRRISRCRAIYYRCLFARRHMDLESRNKRQLSRVTFASNFRGNGARNLRRGRPRGKMRARRKGGKRKGDEEKSAPLLFFFSLSRRLSLKLQGPRRSAGVIKAHLPGMFIKGEELRCISSKVGECLAVTPLCIQPFTGELSRK